MNCRDAREQLQPFLEQELPDRLRRLLEEHLLECEECSSLFLEACSEKHSLGDDEASGLASSVLENTSGLVCEKVQDELSQMLTPRGDNSRGFLLAAHMHNCSSCSSLYRTLLWLQLELPGMLDVELDDQFSRDVLRATSRRPPEPQTLVRRCAGWLKDAWIRPDFPLEAAYLGTLLLAVVFFVTPAMTIQEVAARPLSAIELGMSDSVASAESLVRAELETGSERAGRWLSEVNIAWNRRYSEWEEAFYKGRQGMARGVVEIRDRSFEKAWELWEGVLSFVDEPTAPESDTRGDDF